MTARTASATYYLQLEEMNEATDGGFTKKAFYTNRTPVCR